MSVGECELGSAGRQQSRSGIVSPTGTIHPRLILAQKRNALPIRRGRIFGLNDLDALMAKKPAFDLPPDFFALFFGYLPFVGALHVLVALEFAEAKSGAVALEHNAIAGNDNRIRTAIANTPNFFG